eukprot:s2795_g4.t1
MENVQRDPTTPWKESTGEWRLRTFDGEFYGSANDADLLEGKWYRLGAGDPKMWPTCECPSFFPLPGRWERGSDVDSMRFATWVCVTPGFAISSSGHPWPSHVQKLSCEGHDWWMIGSYTLPDRTRDEVAGGMMGRKVATGPQNRRPLKRLAPGNFHPTVGWEDLFEPQLIDAGAFYASKDALYPSKKGLERRINWGWAQVRPNGTQSLPRVTLSSRKLGGSILVQQSAQADGRTMFIGNLKVSASDPFVARLPFLSALRSETIVRFTLPRSNAILRVGFSPSPVFAFMESVGLAGPDVNVTMLDGSSSLKLLTKVPQEQEKDSGCIAWSYEPRLVRLGSSKRYLSSQSRCGRGDSSCPTSAAFLDFGFYGVLRADEEVFYEPVESKLDVDAICGDIKAPLRLLADEKSLEIRIFADATFLEVFFQGGRLAMTVPFAPAISSELMISSTVETSAEVSAYAMKSIWVNEDYVRKQSRVYPSLLDGTGIFLQDEAQRLGSKQVEPAHIEAGAEMVPSGDGVS